MTELKQECGKAWCEYYGTPDSDLLPCPDDHIMDVHPGVNPDWKPSTYRYHDSRLQELYVTQEPIDDESAFAHFHRITRMGQTYRDVTYVMKAGPGSDKFEMLPVKFEDGSVTRL